MTVDQAEGPLAGLLVADFSRILAGPYATMLLADMGAEVVKVEGPGGDDTRTWQPPARYGSPSGSPVTLISPETAWTMRSYPGSAAPLGPLPKPLIEA